MIIEKELPMKAELTEILKELSDSLVEMRPGRGSWPEHKKAAKILQDVARELVDIADDLGGKQEWGDFPLDMAIDELEKALVKIKKIQKTVGSSH
jgi:hypothetical protein